MGKGVAKLEVDMVMIGPLVFRLKIFPSIETDWMGNVNSLSVSGLSIFTISVLFSLLAT